MSRVKHLLQSIRYNKETIELLKQENPTTPRRAALIKSTITFNTRILEKNVKALKDLGHLEVNDVVFWVGNEKYKRLGLALTKEEVSDYILFIYPNATNIVVIPQSQEFSKIM